MDLITGILLGVIQGATEFLPVSSSGHLVLAEKLLGNKASSGLVFEVMVHFATMISVLIYFRKKIIAIFLDILPPYTPEKAPSLKFAGIIAAATIPAAVLGLAFEDYIEQAFGSGKITSVMLLVTALILLSTRLFKRGNRTVNLKSGFIIGLAQSAALMPGISRSGSTISMGLFLKVAPSEAAEISFLLSLPAVLGACILKSFDLASSPIGLPEFGVYLVGAFTAFVVGYISIVWLMRLIKKGQFFYFGLYCLIIGLLGITLL